MKLIIHRGAKEIGGSCVELQTGSAKILIDFGMPLVTSKQEPFDFKILQNKTINELKASGNLPDIKGLYKNEAKDVDAILISHSHLDHYGFLTYVHPEIPIYMSKGADALIKVSSIFTPSKVKLSNVNIITVKKAVCIKDFKIIPYLVDHSAFDALAFLIEANGKRIFYSGDFRGHGRKSVLFDRIIKDPPKNIDYLLMEGSMIGRGSQKHKAEVDVQKRIEEILCKSNKISFISMSSQNIDRIVSAYKACLVTDSIFVIDIYTAFILDMLKKVSPKIPQFDWKNVRVMFFNFHANALAQAGYRGLLYVYNKKKIKNIDINRQKRKFLIVARDNSIFPNIIKGIKDIEGAKFIYSMWGGYLTDKFKDYCFKKKLIIENVHTSGHATIEDLTAFAKAMNPKSLIPIHTFYPDKYQGLFNNVIMLKDGQNLTL
jgi:ribonuclease J